MDKLFQKQSTKPTIASHESGVAIPNTILEIASRSLRSGQALALLRNALLAMV